MYLFGVPPVKMICRHARGDRSCTTQYPPDPEPPPARSKAKSANTVDAEEYEIVDALQVGSHLVLKVKYPSCSNCSFEGNKVMVFLNKTAMDALKWRRIDPHFRETVRNANANVAPPVAARFPPTAEGWADALAYAQSKANR